MPIIATIAIRFSRIGRLFLLSLAIIVCLKPIQLYSVSTKFFILFAIGGLAAYAFQCYKIPESIMKNKLMSGLTLLAITSSIFYPKTFDVVHIVLIAIFFMLVVFGNDMFGIFSLKASVLLGEISYSIYLLHGIILYLAFSVFNIAIIKNCTLKEYLIFMPLVSIIVILVSAFTFILIEKPSIKYGRKYIFSTIFMPIKT